MSSTIRPLESIEATCRKRFTSFMLRFFFDGRVPWVRWACVRLRTGHSCCADFHATALVKGIFSIPFITSDTDTLHTTEDAVSLTKLQTWQLSSAQCWGFRDEKSLVVFCSPLRWVNVTLWLLRVDRKLDTLAEAENFPWHSFLYARQHGLLSVRTCVTCSDSRMKGAKWFTLEPIAKASCSHGSHLI